MLRKAMAERGVGSTTEFRWRGEEITRIEGFSDAVFAFAVTLLVVSLEVPQTFTELLVTMRGFVAFAICFGLLMLVWYYHYVFFRRYGLQDSYTISLNTALLFVALFYVYPLKFVFTLLTNQILGYGTVVRLPDGSSEEMITAGQDSTLFVIYGLGYAAVFFVFILLYAHAYRKRAELELTELETFDTLTSMQGMLLNCLVGLLSVMIALVGGEGSVSLAGYIYFLIAVNQTVHGIIRGRRRRRIEARVAVVPTSEASESQDTPANG